MKVDPYEVQLAAIGTITALSQGAKFADVQRLLLDHLADECAPAYVASLGAFNTVRRERGAMALRHIALDVARRQMEAAG